MGVSKGSTIDYSVRLVTGGEGIWTKTPKTCEAQAVRLLADLNKIIAFKYM